MAFLVPHSKIFVLKYFSRMDCVTLNILLLRLLASLALSLSLSFFLFLSNNRTLVTFSVRKYFLLVYLTPPSLVHYAGGAIMGGPSVVGCSKINGGGGVLEAEQIG